MWYHPEKNGGAWKNDEIPGTEGVVGTPCVYFNVAGGRQDLVWRKGDGEVWQSFWDSDHWESKAVPGATGAASDPVAYSGQGGVTSRQDIFWTGQDGRIHQAWWGKKKGHDREEWNLDTVPDAANVTGTPFVDHQGDRQDIFFRTVDGKLGQVYWTDRWNKGALEGQAAGGGKVGSDLAGFHKGDRQDLFYLDGAGNLCQTFWDGRWEGGKR
jgi:hypothetical protein